MKLLYAGFDTVDVAIQGVLSPDSLKALETARDDAAKRQEPVLIKLGSGNVAMHVHSSGLRGGYAFRADTGPLGEILAFKANTDTNEWNGFASIRASALAAYGYRAAIEQLWWRLGGMGFTVRGHSVNRIDFAMDFLTGPFELNLDRFIAHPRTKTKPHWGTIEQPSDRNRPSAVCRGRRLESVTIGKMPGRQVIVYNKRQQAIEQRKFFWFRVWGIDRNDRSLDIWRVELRAGKKELKDRWGIRTFDNVYRIIGDLFRATLEEVRYVAPHQRDSNVTRQSLDPLWIAAIENTESGLHSSRSGLLPSQVREIERQIALDTYSALALGNLAGWAVAQGLDGDEIEAELAERVRALVVGAINDSRGKFRMSIDRARERLHFIR